MAHWVAIDLVEGYELYRPTTAWNLVFVPTLTNPSDAAEIGLGTSTKGFRQLLDDAEMGSWHFFESIAEQPEVLMGTIRLIC